MYECDNCGYEVEPAMRFCPNCGHELDFEQDPVPIIEREPSDMRRGYGLGFGAAIGWTVSSCLMAVLVPFILLVGCAAIGALSN